MTIRLDSLLMFQLLEKTMVNKKLLEEVKNRLVETYNPIAIYLFGSYAWGKPVFAGLPAADTGFVWLRR